MYYKFRDVEGMLFLDVRDQLRDQLCTGLDHEHDLRFAVDFAVPPVGAGNVGDHVDAGSELVLDDGGGQGLGDCGGRGGGEGGNEGGLVGGGDSGRAETEGDRERERERERARERGRARERERERERDSVRTRTRVSGNRTW